MPSVSEKQHKAMLAAAHSPEVAKAMGIPQSVAKEFAQADAHVKKYVANSNRPKKA